MSPKARGVLFLVMAAAVGTVAVLVGPGRNIVRRQGELPDAHWWFGHDMIPTYLEYSLEGYWHDAPWLAVLGTALVVVAWRRRRRLMKFAREQDDASEGTLNGSNG